MVFFPKPLDIKVFTHNAYWFYFSNELAKFPDNLINLG